MKVILSQLTEKELRTLLREELQAIAEQNLTNSTAPHQQTIFNFSQGCEYLGISKSHGYKLTSQRLIPYSKQGKRIFFEKSELDKWLLSNKKVSIVELQQDMNNYLSPKSKGDK